MALAGYKAPISAIEFGNNSFAVKGVSLNELAVLIQANLSDLELVFSAVKDEQLAPWEVDCSDMKFAFK